MNDLIKSVMMRYLNESVGSYNDPETRLAISAGIAEFVKGLYNQGKLAEYHVICDERNNNAKTLDRNGLVADLYVRVKPDDEDWIHFHGTVSPDNVEVKSNV